MADWEIHWKSVYLWLFGAGGLFLLGASIRLLVLYHRQGEHAQVMTSSFPQRKSALRRMRKIDQKIWRGIQWWRYLLKKVGIPFILVMTAVGLWLLKTSWVPTGLSS